FLRANSVPVAKPGTPDSHIRPRGYKLIWPATDPEPPALGDPSTGTPILCRTRDDSTWPILRRSSLKSHDGLSSRKQAGHPIRLPPLLPSRQPVNACRITWSIYSAPAESSY